MAEKLGEVGAFPNSGYERWAPECGLSKRELFAAFIMQGLVQDPNMDSMDRAAEGAVEGADKLLAALAGPSEVGKT